MPPVRAIQHRSMRAHPLPLSACTHSSKQAAIQNAALQTRRDARIDTTAASFVHRSKLCTAGRRIPVALTPTSINSTALRAVRAPLGLGGLRVAAERANMDPAQQAQLSARALQRDGRRGKRRQCRGAASAGSAGARQAQAVQGRARTTWLRSISRPAWSGSCRAGCCGPPRRSASGCAAARRTPVGTPD